MIFMILNSTAAMDYFDLIPNQVATAVAKVVGAFDQLYGELQHSSSYHLVLFAVPTINSKGFRTVTALSS